MRLSYMEQRETRENTILSQSVQYALSMMGYDWSIPYWGRYYTTNINDVLADLDLTNLWVSRSDFYRLEVSLNRRQIGALFRYPEGNSVAAIRADKFLDLNARREIESRRAVFAAFIRYICRPARHRPLLGECQTYISIPDALSTGACARGIHNVVADLYQRFPSKDPIVAVRADLALSLPSPLHIKNYVIRAYFAALKRRDTLPFVLAPEQYVTDGREYVTVKDYARLLHHGDVAAFLDRRRCA